jgi:hypothetical protein
MTDKKQGDRVHQSVYTGVRDFGEGKVYHFMCDCGNEFTIKHTSKLKNGGKFRCRDCYVLRDSESYSPEWGYRLALKRIKNDAARAGREFAITLDEFMIISQKNCYYCKLPPSNKLTYVSNAGNFTREFIYSGMDRVDNEIGYIPTNVVPCCIICNRAKNNMSFGEFIAWIDRLKGTNDYGIGQAQEVEGTGGRAGILESSHSG